MRLKILIVSLALLVGFVPREINAQASPYSISKFPSQTFTATGQTGNVIQLNGLTVPSTVGSSFASANIVVTTSAITTATFAIQGSSDGTNFFPLLISPVANPSGTATTATVTANAMYSVSLSGLTHVRFVTSGTFTGSSLTLQLAASPNANLSRNNGNGSQVYPGAGVAVSNGSGWGSSLAAPSSALVGISDTQTLTNKTLDGVTPTTMSYLDATSSIQGQFSSKVNKSGDTMTGPLVLPADPTTNLQAATKQYVDNHASGVNSFNTRNGNVTLQASDVNAVGAITNSTSGNAATATTTSQVNGCNIPTSSGYVGTNSSGCIVAASTPSATTLQTNGVNNSIQTTQNLQNGNNIAMTNSGANVTVGVTAPGTALQMTVKCATGSALCASNVATSSDGNSLSAPDQLSANRVNGLFSMDNMGTNIQTNLVTKMACATSGNCNSISGSATPTTDNRILPVAGQSYVNAAIGVNPGTGFVFPATNSLMMQQGFFGVNSSNPTYSFTGSGFIAHPFSLNVSHTLQNNVNINATEMSSILNNVGANSDDFFHGHRDNFTGHNVSVNSAGGQVGGVFGGNCKNQGTGDCVLLSMNAIGVGTNQGDGEGTEIARQFAWDQTDRFGMALNVNASSLTPTNGIYNITGIPIAGSDYKFDALGNRNLLINLDRGYSTGNVQTISKCALNGINQPCLKGDGTSNWVATFGVSVMDSCSLSATVPPPLQNETGTNVNSVPCVVTDSTRYAVNDIVTLSGTEIDACQVMVIPDNTHMTLACHEGHSSTIEAATANSGPETISKGGLAGYAVVMGPDFISKGTFATKIGNYAGGNTNQDIRRQVLPIIGLDSSGNAYLNAGIWTEYPTLGLGSNTAIGPSSVTVTTDGSGNVTGLTINTQTDNGYAMPSTNGGIPAQFPLPTITFSAGCTATASFAPVGYVEKSNKSYVLPNLTLTNGGIITQGAGTCAGATATIQTVYSNPYTFYPYAKSYSILSVSGNQMQTNQVGASSAAVSVTLNDKTLWTSGNKIENEIYNHNRIHRGYTQITGYGQLASRQGNASDNILYTGLGVNDTAVYVANGLNADRYPSRNNPPSSGKAYTFAPTYTQVVGAWQTLYDLPAPYPPTFATLYPSANVTNFTQGVNRGNIFNIHCLTSAQNNIPGGDCKTTFRDDFNLFRVQATDTTLMDLYVSPDRKDLNWTHNWHVGGTTAMDGAVTVNGTMTFSSSLNIPTLAPGNSVVAVSTSYPAQANQYFGGFTCTGTSTTNLTMPSTPGLGAILGFSNSQTTGSCNVLTTQGISNGGTPSTNVSIPSGGWLIIRYNGSVWNIIAQSQSVTLATGSTNQIAVYTGSGTIGGTTAIPNGTTATTQTAGDNSTKVATTAYVNSAVSAQGLGTMSTQNASGVAITGGTMSGVAISGGSVGSTTTGTTQTAGDNSTKLATTAYVDNAFALAGVVASSTNRNSTANLGSTTVYTTPALATYRVTLSLSCHGVTASSISSTVTAGSFSSGGQTVATITGYDCSAGQLWSSQSAVVSLPASSPISYSVTYSSGSVAYDSAVTVERLTAN